MAYCEDAPCCGCCGTNIYGVYQGEGSYYDYSDPRDDDYMDGPDYDDSEPDLDFGFEHDSAMTSAGWGTDEDYGYYGDEDAAMEYGLFGDC